MGTIPRIDSKVRFTAAADDYARYRPSYPAEAIDWIIAGAQLTPGARVIDVGCGTGIATRLFAARGYDAVGIDPNEEMLAHARRAGGAIYLRGESSATGLPDASADLAVSAQAFHWFDLPTTLAELGRVLRPPRWTAALWNIRADGPDMDAYEQILVAHSPEYRELFGGDSRIAVRAAAGVVDVREVDIPHTEELGWERFWGRVRSSSYVVHGVDDMPSFERALRAFFDRYAEAGTLAWRYRTEIILFRIAP